MIPLIPMLVYLGISPHEANKLAEKHKNNTIEIQKELQQIASKKGIQPVKTNLQHTPMEKEVVEAPKQPSDINEKTNKIDENKKYIAKYIADNEGRNNSAYEDSKGNWTIGIGHLIIEKNLFGKSYDNLISGKQSLTNDEVDSLFLEDLKEHENRTKRLFPKFDQYPKNIQAALIDSVYRGDMGPKTKTLINLGKLKDASNEYINSREYYSSKTGVKGRGIYKRMDRNREQFLQYAKELGQI